MSETLSLSGIDYVPATLAGKTFGYTSDYITLLAREGKIEATKIGKQWFVREDSVRDFIEHKTKEKSERSETIRTARKLELKENITKQETVRKKEIKSYHKIALTETLVILIIGLSLGASGYVMTSQRAQSASLASASYSAIERLALSVFAFISGEGGTKSDSYTNIPQNQVNSLTQEGTPELAVTIGTTTRTSLIVAPDEVLTTTTIESIRDSFSDDVSVSIDPKNPDTGVIIPNFKEKKSETYRFLMVPVNPSGG